MDSVKRYEPVLYDGNQDIDKLFSVNKEEIENLHIVIKKTIDNTVLQTADLKGVELYEKLHDIYSENSLSLEERKTNLYNKIAFTPPFTKNSFKSILQNIWGEGNYFFEIYYDTLEVIIDIDTTDPNIYLPFQSYVKDVIPANIFLILAIQYTHLYLKRQYTHGEIDLTYGQLSQYANLRRKA